MTSQHPMRRGTLKNSQLVRLGSRRNRIKGVDLGMVGLNPLCTPCPLRSPQLRWSRYVDYHINLERHHVFGRNHPGNPPPRYREFRRLYERRDPWWIGRDAHTETQQRFPHHEPPSSTDGLISMPPEALTSFFNVQRSVPNGRVDGRGQRWQDGSAVTSPVRSAKAQDQV